MRYLEGGKLTCNRNEFWAKNPQKVKNPCVIFQSPKFENVINTKYLAHKNLLENSFSLLLT